MQERFNDSQSAAKSIQNVTKLEPCLHCGKPDWCYRLGELTVCKRRGDPADGWEKTSKTDRDGSFYYAPEQPKKAPRPAGKKDYFYCDRQGNKFVRVTHHYGEGKKQGCPQSHWDANRRRYINGLTDEIKLQIPLYRYPEIKEAINRGETIFFVEGEGKAEALVKLGLQATTAIGGAEKYRAYGSYKEDLEGANLVLCPDRDKPGLRHMEDVYKDFPDAQWLYAPPSDYFWEQIAESGGLDIGDWIRGGATKEDIEAAIGDKMYGGEKTLTQAEESSLNGLDFSLPEVEQIFTQKAAADLFSDTKWISLNGHLHRWTGSHYELVADSIVKAKIAKWCASTPVWNKQKETYAYGYAKSSVIENIWNWISLVFGVDPALVNPPGINCLNGTVRLHWKGKKVTWQLEPHSTDDLYLYTNKINYDPKADQTQCDRLLACLEPDQQDILLKTLAASLDLATVRKYRSRIKSIFNQGDGNNGKDSIREAASYLYGSSMTSATISDFQVYDGGKKFPLAKLENSLINWSSENASLKSIDGLQSLKAAITGEPLDVERKNQDERPMLLNTVFFFNINEAPNLQAGLEAIQSRWAILSFNKTFKVGADISKGELEADSRFRYDPEFLQAEVVPALLNRVLDALPKLMEEGIDYSCTQRALESIQQKTNHLWAFASEVGLSYSNGGRVYINELWGKLKDWYIANGTLEIVKNNEGKEKQEWHDQAGRYDKNVKAANQVHQRFSELFPKITRRIETQIIDRKGQSYLDGIAVSEAVGKASEAVSEPIGEAVSRSQSGSEASEPIESTLLQFLRQIEQLEPLELRRIMLKIKNGSDVGLIASLASLADVARAVASPTASLTASPASLTASPASLEDEQVIYASDSNFSKAVTQSPITDSTIHTGDSTKTASDNVNNFFSTAHSCFRVGDRCKVKRPFWGIPNEGVCTIHKINNGVATVFYKGCQSPSGVDVPLAELELVE